MRHSERHRTEHIGWLRASVLGANDGLISTASLIVGVAASGTERSAVLVAGIAGMVAGDLNGRHAEPSGTDHEDRISRCAATLPQCVQ